MIERKIERVEVNKKKDVKLQSKDDEVVIATYKVRGHKGEEIEVVKYYSKEDMGWEE